MKSKIHKPGSMLIITLAHLLICSLSFAQAPQGISYQAVIRNAANELVINSPIGIKVSILQDSSSGTVVYSETHLPTSNANGLVSFVIGGGTIVSGVFAEIEWAFGPYFIKTEVDPTGGTTYTIEGISQMLSVPYSLHSQSITLTSENGHEYQIKVDDYGNIVKHLVYNPECPSSLTDVDGNIYNVVTIGFNCWMKENLKTTRYRDATPVEYPGNDNNAWQNNTTGAYAWYDNDINWKDSYGALYNWHAVNSANGLCPTGWHIPTDTEWTQLTNYIGGTFSPNGNKMKSCRMVNSPLGGECNTTEHPRWNSNNTHYGTDDFGFSGLPGGYRHFSGTFNYIGDDGYWWGSTEETVTNAWHRFLNYPNGFVNRNNYDKGYGFSVRCLRD